MPRTRALGLLLALLAGCTPVQPWERGTLAQPHMALDPHPLRSGWRTHVQATREGAPAAGLSEGGGCGCY
jgi:hypothetical protein